MIKWTGIALFLGFLIDLLLGDPRWLYHPVRIIGNGISVFEKHLRNLFPKTEKGERKAGFVLVILICFLSGFIPFVILYVGYQIHTILGIAMESFFCYQMLAVKSLKQESMKVYEELKKGDLQGARHAVSMIVGRDTKALDENGVTKAAVETIAENTSDGIIAPLFYMAIGGPVLMFIYKGINTMDSMVGYKNETYLLFGRAAAKMDDAVNWLPARLSGMLLTAAAWLLPGMDGKNAWRIFKRDRFNHASPNSAQGEAACAGALHLRLAGDAWYFGTLYKKPYIGDDDRPIRPDDIKGVCSLMFGAQGLLMAGLVILLLLL